MKAVYSGRIASFDDFAGRGEIEAGGGMRFPFHCTAIADGTREIAPGTRVKFEVTPGLGRWEAAALEPV